MSQCRHNAMAPGSRTLVAGPSERLPAAYVMHNAAGASPGTCPVVCGLLSCGRGWQSVRLSLPRPIALALHMPLATILRVFILVPGH